MSRELFVANKLTQVFRIEIDNLCADMHPISDSWKLLRKSFGLDSWLLTLFLVIQVQLLVEVLQLISLKF